MQKWFLFYTKGYCTDYDHEFGLKEFDTEAEARQEMARLLDPQDISLEIILIEGVKKDSYNYADTLKPTPSSQTPGTTGGSPQAG